MSTLSHDRALDGRTDVSVHSHMFQASTRIFEAEGHAGIRDLKFTHLEYYNSTSSKQTTNNLIRLIVTSMLLVMVVTIRRRLIIRRRMITIIMLDIPRPEPGMPHPK